MNLRQFLKSVTIGVGSLVAGIVPRFVKQPLVIDPCDFGALPDGVTDCAPAIQAAMLEAHKLGMSLTFKTPGRYLIASTVHYPNNVATMRPLDPKNPGWIGIP